MNITDNGINMLDSYSASIKKFDSINYDYNCIDEIKVNSDVKLNDYLKGIYSEAKHMKPVCERSRSILRACLEEVICKDSQLDNNDLTDALQDFDIYPVIKTVEHAELMLHKNTILSNYLHSYAARSVGVRHFFSKQCTRVKSINCNKSLTGPAIIPRGEGKYLKIYGLGINKLSKTPVVCLNNITTDFQYINSDREIMLCTDYPKILEKYNNTYYERSVYFINCVNRYIWRNIEFNSKSEIVLFDEDFVCELVARLLLDQDNAFYKLFSNQAALIYLLNERKKAKESNVRCQIDGTTDFFWYRGKKSLNSLKLEITENSKLRLVCPVGKIEPIEFEARKLAKLMDERIIYPDNTISYFVTSLFPGVVNLGGGSQSEYLPKIKEILIATCKKFNILNIGQQDTLEENQISKLLFYGLLEADQSLDLALCQMDGNDDLDQLIEDKLRYTLKESVGELNAFKYLLSL
ncbi:hypothetical protein GCM10007932_42360 [Vibrio penaeicida]|uniref:Uncharacterized protein n=4 Tax=Vibrio penaeicida TaxID=104609 RepID=A0AAV5NWF5_9VIBR|nr:hypothetical protein GCM10007932_42360 [Vibrio penaeicida]